MSSLVITCHYLSSPVITHNHLSLHAITCNYLSFPVITCHYLLLLLSVTFGDYQWLNVITCHNCHYKWLPTITGHYLLLSHYLWSLTFEFICHYLWLSSPESQPYWSSSSFTHVILHLKYNLTLNPRNTVCWNLSTFTATVWSEHRV